MSDVPSVQLPFGTVAAVFPTPDTAAQAAALLADRGYPRELISVLAGRPWQQGEPPPSGFVADPELRYALIPASPADVPAVTPQQVPAQLAHFAGPLLSKVGKRPNPARWTAIAAVIGAAAVVASLFTRDWFTVTIVLLIAVQAVVVAAVLAYVRREDASFPFRERIPDVDSTLEQGGALVTVRCTLPYASTVVSVLTEAGGDVLGYARDRVYPVMA